MTSVLNKDEKRIVDILSRHGGKSGQKVLVRESDFSKAKVSRLVKNLKERGVVDIEPISGRENRIILKFDKKPDAEKPQEKESPQTVDVVEKPQKDPVIDTESYEPDEEITE
jgi:DNA-binding Lrp family transcriptional regulator